jgi:prophage antirepressor-like protein
MNEISTFKVPAEIIADGKVRVVLKDGEPWFVAKDISSALGYRDSSDMLKRLDEDEVFKATRDKSGSFIPKSFFGNQGYLNLIDESGLYTSILGSKIKGAKRFKKWVTKEVLPSIRKTGSYSVKGEEPQAEVSKISEKERIENNLLALKFAQDNLAVSDEDRTRMARKMFDTFGLDTSYFPDFVDGEATFSLTQLLKQNGVKMSAKKVNTLLEADGIIEKKFRDSSKTKLIKDENGDEVEIKVQKQFWSITEAGGEFGKNVVSTHGSSTETQVRFFEEKFMELLEKLEIDCNCQKS